MISHNSMVDLLQSRAAEVGSEPVFRFLHDVEGRFSDLTYAQLDQQAKEVAFRLLEMGLAKKPVLLVYPPGLDYIVAFWGCLYAGAIAVPIYRPHLNRPAARYHNVVKQAQPHAYLSNQASINKINSRPQKFPVLAKLPSVATDKLDTSVDGAWQPPSPKTADLAFLQFTSGSTQAPKGVMVSHGNLMSNAKALWPILYDVAQKARQSGTQFAGCFWLPIYHDMGLLGGIVQTVVMGGASILMSPTTFLQKPLFWLQTMSEHGCAITSAPNFAYELCVKLSEGDALNGLDLRALKVLFNGAEPIRTQSMADFAARFASYGFESTAFFPSYGLAEATLFVSGGHLEEAAQTVAVDETALQNGTVQLIGADNPAAKQIASSGVVASEHTVHIVDPETAQRCDPEKVGEIWVSGPNVAQGYWSQPELSASSFQAKVTGDAADQKLFLRTGDLGFMRGDELFVTGRLKDMLIIHGRNHYPHDIEWVVEQSHLAIQPTCTAAVLLGEEHEAKLAITAEIKRSLRYNLNHEEVVQAIREAVAREHQLEVAAVALLNPTQTPRTSSGKIQRYLCREIFTTNTPEPLYLWWKPERPLELTDEPNEERDNSLSPQQLLHELRDEFALFLNVEPEEIDTTKPLYAFGLGSIGAIALQTHLETTYDLKIPVNMFFDDLCLDDIVVEIMQLLPTPETDEDW